MIGETSRAIADVGHERVRQDHLVADGVIPWNLTDPQVEPGRKLNVLAEEVLEVVREIVNGRIEEGRLYAELTQVAACAVAWMEALGPRCGALKAKNRCDLVEGHGGVHAFRGVVTWN